MIPWDEVLGAKILASLWAFLMIVPLALIMWWLHRYVPFIPDMGLGQCLALVVIVHVLRRWS